MINALLWTLALAAADLKPQVTGGTQAMPIATPGGPPVAPPSATAVPGQPTIFPALQQQQQALQQKQADKAAKAQQQQQMIQQMLSAMSGANAPSRGDRVPEGTDYSKWEYPDSFKFQSGRRGAGNIGNGLCTSANANRTQMKKNGNEDSLCMQLSDLLGDPNTCAGRAMAAINKDPMSIKGMNDWCPNIKQLQEGKERQNVFMQVLATLITQESGWASGVTENAWKASDGSKREGKGLFQIGEWDYNQDADCAGINIKTVYEPKANMKCGACIAMKNIVQDQAMGGGSLNEAYGMARYFGPLRELQKDKRAAMQGAVKNYCLSSRSGSNAPAGSESTK